MRSTVISILIIATFLSAVPLFASAQTFSLVPCGRSDQQPTKEELAAEGFDLADHPFAQCNIRHFIIAVVRLTNYLISAAALVAMYQVLSAGWNLIGSMGNAEKAMKAKQGISNAVVGFVIVVMAFVFVNLPINGLMGSGDKEKPTRWWDINCMYDITNSTTAQNNCTGTP